MSSSGLPARAKPARSVAAFFLLALIILCSAARADPTPRVGYLLWEVGSADRPLFLLGSVHVARPDIYPLPPAYDAAYDRAEVLVVEADPADAVKLKEAMSLMTYAPPDGLDRHISEQTWKTLQELAATAKFDPEQLRRLKPVILASAITFGAAAEHGFSSEAGVDQYFLKRARADGKPVIELESLGYQAELMGALSDDDGDALIMQALEGIGTGESLRVMDGMADAWKAGDSDRLHALIDDQNRDPVSQRLYARLFDERNAAMAERIAATVGTRPALVVIGAGHLLGRNSVVELLQARGLSVRRVEN